MMKEEASPATLKHVTLLSNIEFEILKAVVIFLNNTLKSAESQLMFILPVCSESRNKPSKETSLKQKASTCIMLVPYVTSPLEDNSCFGGTSRLHLQAHFQWTKQHYISEDKSPPLTHFLTNTADNKIILTYQTILQPFPGAKGI
jgi:hypothetical protein